MDREMECIAGGHPAECATQPCSLCPMQVPAPLECYLFACPQQGKSRLCKTVESRLKPLIYFWYILKKKKRINVNNCSQQIPGTFAADSEETITPW